MSRFAEYAIAALLAGVAWAVRWWLDPWLGVAQPIALFYIPITVVAWWFGWRPAMLTALLGLALAWWFFLPTRHSLAVFGIDGWISIATYAFVCFTIISLMSRLRTAQRRAEAKERAMGEEKERFQTLFEKNPEPFFLVNPAGRFVQANPACEKVSGYSIAEFLEKSFMDLCAPDQRAHTVEIFQKTLRERVPHQVETGIIRKDGRRVEVLVTANLLLMGGEVSVVYCSARDITKRTQAKEAAQAALEKAELERRRLSAVLEALPTGVAIADINGKIIRFNAALTRIWGKPPPPQSAGEYGHWKGRWVKTGKPLAANDWAMARTLRTGEVVPGDVIEIEKFDGTGRATILNAAAPIRDPEGRIVGGVVAEVDITAQKRTEAALRESEERMRLFVENAPASIALFDRQMRYLGLSRRWMDDYGLTGTVIGRSHYEVFPEISEVWKAVHKRVLAGEVMKAEADWFERADGKVQWVKWEALPWFTATGEIGGMMIASEEITARKEAEEALRQSEEHFRALAEAMPQFVWITRADGYDEYFNQQWHDYTETTLEETRGDRWSHTLHPDDYQRTLDRWHHSLRTGEPYENEYRIRRASDGSYRWFLGRALPVRNAQGEIVRWFGTSTDIDEQKRTLEALRASEERVRETKDALARANEALEEKVQERTAKLQEMVAELEHFSYTITHDMRAPLRAMQGFGTILMEECSECAQPMQKDLIRRIAGAAGRMDRLITDALNFGKIMRQQFDLLPVDPALLLREIVESYPQFHPPKAEIIIQEPLPKVLANEAGLTQCFSNLLGNAIKFVEPSKTPQVRIWAETRDEWVRLWFADNGIGIAKEYQDTIWVMFQRLSKSGEGTGVGLALVKKAVERMRGQVGVESEPGKGSRFWVELRRAG